MQRKFIEIMLHYENQNKLLVYFIADNIALLSKNKHFAHISTYNSYDSKKRRCMSCRNKKLETIMIIISSSFFCKHIHLLGL